MKDFFKTFFASFLATALVAAIGFVLILITFAAIGASAKVEVPAKAVLVMDLSMSVTDGPSELSPNETIQKAMQGGGAPSLPLLSIINALDRAAKDKNISALYLTGNLVSSNYSSGPAALKELREALLRFRKESGKPIIAYNVAYQKRDLFLSAVADKVYLSPLGFMDMTGPQSEIMFLAGAFKKYGIEIQPTRVGKYKSYIEPFILEKMSPENREQITLMMKDLWNEWKSTLAADRKKTPEFLQQLADTKGAMVAQDALRAGLVDKLLNHDEVLDELKTLAGKGSKDKDFPQIAMEDYVKIPDTAKGKNRIAVVYAEGGIVDGEGPGQVGGDRLSRELRRLRLDSGVKAIVLRVNSPGGSALASELIQRELVVTRKAGKPVVVSMGTVAASGGYWISIFSDRIFAEPNTITGSIGVVGMIPSIKKLANEHGVTWDSVQMAKLGIPGLSRPATPEELKRTQDMVDEVYDLFLTKVAEGRNLPKDKVHEIAQGRVWSGKEALNLKLVDELGGLQDAVKCAAKLAKIENDYRVDSPTPPKSPMENLMKAFGGGEKRKLVRSSGPAEQLKAGLEQAYRKLELLSDPRGIYAVMPYEITIR